MIDTALAPLLDISTIGQNTFESPPLSFGRRVLGGGLIASAVLVAARTLTDPRRPTALHITFCRAARPDSSVTFEVAATLDGARSSVRRVTARQHDRLVAEATVRFHDDIAADSDSADATDPDAVPTVDGGHDSCSPDSCSPEHSVLATLDLVRDLDVRAPDPGDGRRTMHPYWIKVPAVPDVHGLHEALVGLITDLGTSTVPADPSTPFRERLTAVSLDHAIWWPRPPKAHHWLRVDAEPLVTRSHGGLAQGRVRDADARLVATFTQEVTRAG